MSDIANPERGELSIEINGETYILKLSLRAILELERLIKPRKYRDILVGVQAGDLDDLMLWLWTALRTRHPKLASKDLENATLNIAELVDAAGGLDTLHIHIRALMKLNERPPELAPPNGDGNADPQDAVETATAVETFPGAGSSLTGSAAA